MAFDSRTRWLAAAGVLGGGGQSLAGSAGALLAARLGHGSGLAGLPQALTVAGAAAATLAVARLTGRWGRGPALAAGYGAGAAGAAAVVVGASAGSLPLVLVASLLVGGGQAAMMLGRYAAADLVPVADRGRAMGRMLTIVTVGAVAGPNLLAPTDDLGRAVGLPALAGPYAVTLITAVLAAGCLQLGVARGPARRTDPAPPVRAAWTRRSVAGLVVLSVANLTMVAVMTMAPLHLHDLGTGLGLVGVVISLHIAGMFVPSAFSGRLTDRIGPIPVAGLAATALIAACVWAAGAMSTPGMTGAMVLLGVGWNLALLSGSALLTADSSAAARPAREGWGDVGMGVAASGGGVASGLMMSGGGYGLLAVTGALVAAAIVPAAMSAHTASPANRTDREEHAWTSPH